MILNDGSCAFIIERRTQGCVYDVINERYLAPFFNDPYSSLNPSSLCQEHGTGEVTCSTIRFDQEESMLAVEDGHVYLPYSMVLSNSND